MFVPTASMPSWLQVFTGHQPVTVVANAVRELSAGTATWTIVGHAAIWIIAIFVVAFPVAVGLYRRASQ